MRDGSLIAVVIPALDEEESIRCVLGDIPGWVDDIIVVDNGSADATACVALENGARVVSEPIRGYGAACLAGLGALKEADVVVFLDADYSDHPDEMATLVDPILSGAAELVIGSRLAGCAERGALLPQARFGNMLACLLMRVFWGVRFTDLGPFRAIDRRALDALAMDDTGYGWTIQMQIRAAREGQKCMEVPVSYRKRIGTSKISGTVKGTILAGAKILYTIFSEALAPRQRRL